MAKFKHTILQLPCSSKQERETLGEKLDQLSTDGYALVTSQFVPGGIFYGLLKRTATPEEVAADEATAKLKAAQKAGQRR